MLFRESSYPSVVGARLSIDRSRKCVDINQLSKYQVRSLPEMLEKLLNISQGIGCLPFHRSINPCKHFLKSSSPNRSFNPRYANAALPYSFSPIAWPLRTFTGVIIGICVSSDGFNAHRATR